MTEFVTWRDMTRRTTYPPSYTPVCEVARFSPGSSALAQLPHIDERA